MGGPLVSVIMNCFNGEKYLSEALQSVIDQTHHNWEIIFWDNLSVDRSAEVFQSFGEKRFRYFLAEEHTNLGQARARAWEKARGEFVAVLDVDDIWLPEKLEKQLKLFNDSSVGMVICDTYFFNKDRRWRLYGNKLPPTGHVFEELLSNYFVSLETLVLRKTTVDSIGHSFDPNFSHIADFDLVVRTARISKLALVSEVLAGWRIHENNESKLRPDKFITEKKDFLRKLDSLDIPLDKKYRKARKNFIGSISRSEAIQLLINGRRRNALRALGETLPFDWKAWILVAICFAPCPRLIASRLREGRL